MRFLMIAVNASACAVVLALNSSAKVFVYLRSIHYLSRINVRLTPLQSLTYSVQTSVLSPLLRFITCPPHTCYLPLTTLQLTSLQISVLSSLQFVTYLIQMSDSPSIVLLLIPYKPRSYPSSNTLLTPYKPRSYPVQPSDLPLFKHATYPVQLSDLTLGLIPFKHPTYPSSNTLLIPYKCPTYPSSIHSLSRKKVRLTPLQTRYLLGNTSPFNATQRFRMICIEGVTYSRTTVVLTPRRKVRLTPHTIFIQSHTYSHIMVGFCSHAGLCTGG